MGLHLKPSCRRRGCSGGLGGSSLLSLEARPPAPSLKDPQLVSKAPAASYKALPLLSPAKPPSVAMVTEQRRQAALRALPTPSSPTPSAGPGLWAPGSGAGGWLGPHEPGSSRPSLADTCFLHRRPGKALPGRQLPESCPLAPPKCQPVPHWQTAGGHRPTSPLCIHQEATRPVHPETSSRGKGRPPTERVATSRCPHLHLLPQPSSHGAEETGG